MKVYCVIDGAGQTVAIYDNLAAAESHVASAQYGDGIAEEEVQSEYVPDPRLIF